jgi:hypothetical protein
MRKWLFAVTLAALGVTVATYSLPAQRDPQSKEPSVQALMKKKLEYAQHLLEALSTNDLAAAGKDADNLNRIRREASFRIIKTPEYEFCADSFQQSLDGVVKAAKENNLEAAKLHYLGMTMACFNCHAYVRDMRKKG